MGMGVAGRGGKEEGREGSKYAEYMREILLKEQNLLVKNKVAQLNKCTL